MPACGAVPRSPRPDGNMPSYTILQRTFETKTGHVRISADSESSVSPRSARALLSTPRPAGGSVARVRECRSSLGGLPGLAPEATHIESHKAKKRHMHLRVGVPYTVTFSLPRRCAGWARPPPATPPGRCHGAAGWRGAAGGDLRSGQVRSGQVRYHIGTRPKSQAETMRVTSH